MLMQEYGIPTEIWHDLIGTIRANSKVHSVILFGSRAKGNPKPGSDIDLAIQGNDLKTAELISLLVQIDALELPWKIDLVNFASIKDQNLIDHIRRCGIPVG
jgi:uncharacterized protein